MEGSGLTRARPASSVRLLRVFLFTRNSFRLHRALHALGWRRVENYFQASRSTTRQAPGECGLRIFRSCARSTTEPARKHPRTHVSSALTSTHNNTLHQLQQYSLFRLEQGNDVIRGQRPKPGHTGHCSSPVAESVSINLTSNAGIRSAIKCGCSVENRTATRSEYA